VVNAVTIQFAFPTDASTAATVQSTAVSFTTPVALQSAIMAELTSPSDGSAPASLAIESTGDTGLVVLSPPSVTAKSLYDRLVLLKESVDPSVALAVVFTLFFLAAGSRAGYLYYRRRQEIWKMRKEYPLPPHAQPGARTVELKLRGEFNDFKKSAVAQKELLEKLAKCTGKYDARGNFVDAIDPKRLSIVNLKAGSIIVSICIAEDDVGAEAAREKASAQKVAAEKAAQIAESAAAGRLQLGAATKVNAFAGKLKSKAEAAAIAKSARSAAAGQLQLGASIKVKVFGGKLKSKAEAAADKAEAEAQAAAAAAAAAQALASSKAKVAAAVRKAEAAALLRATEAQVAAEKAARVARSAAAGRLQLGASTKAKTFGSKLKSQADETSAIAKSAIAGRLELGASTKVNWFGSKLKTRAEEEAARRAEAQAPADIASIAASIAATAVEVAVEAVVEAAAKAAAAADEMAAKAEAEAEAEAANAAAQAVEAEAKEAEAAAALEAANRAEAAAKAAAEKAAIWKAKADKAAADKAAADKATAERAASARLKLGASTKVKSFGSRLKSKGLSPYTPLSAHEFENKLLAMTPAMMGYAIGHRVLSLKDTTLRNPDGSPSTPEDRVLEAIVVAIYAISRLAVRWARHMSKFSKDCLIFYWIWARTCSLAKAKAGTPPGPGFERSTWERAWVRAKSKIAPKRTKEEKEEREAHEQRERQLDVQSLFKSRGKTWLDQKTVLKQQRIDMTRDLQKKAGIMGTQALNIKLSREGKLAKLLKGRLALEATLATAAEDVARALDNFEDLAKGTLSQRMGYFQDGRWVAMGDVLRKAIEATRPLAVDAYLAFESIGKEEKQLGLDSTNDERRRKDEERHLKEREALDRAVEQVKQLGLEATTAEKRLNEAERRLALEARLATAAEDFARALENFENLAKGTLFQRMGYLQDGRWVAMGDVLRKAIEATRPLAVDALSIGKEEKQLGLDSTIDERRRKVEERYLKDREALDRAVEQVKQLGLEATTAEKRLKEAERILNEEVRAGKLANAKRLLAWEAKRLEMDKPPPPPILSEEERILVGNLRFERNRDPARLASLDWSFGPDGKVSVDLKPTGTYEEVEAAVVVQAAIRGKKGKKEKKEKKAKKEKEVQAKKEDSAAVTVQAAMRGKKGKKAAQERVEEIKQQEEKMEEEAATVVQTAARGQKAKKEKKEKKEKKAKVEAAVKIVQPHVRAFIERLHAKWTPAVLVMQSALRMRRAIRERKTRQRQRDAVLAVQMRIRMRLAVLQRKALIRAKELLEAEKRLPRAEQEARAEAATKVQAKVRAVQAKAEVAEMREKGAAAEAELAFPDEIANGPLALVVATTEDEAAEKAATEAEALPESATNGAKGKKGKAKKEAKGKKKGKAGEEKEAAVKTAAEEAELAEKASKFKEAKEKMEERVKVVEKKIQDKKDNFAATMVQIRFRMKLALLRRRALARAKQDALEFQAAALVQSNVRMEQAKKERARLKALLPLTKAAIRLQARARTHLVLWTIQRAKEAAAATKIQTRVRMRQAQAAVKAKRLEAERLAAAKAEAERLEAAAKAEAERLEAAAKAEAERLEAAAKAEAERLAAAKAEAERLAELERVAAEKAEAERLAAEEKMRHDAAATRLQCRARQRSAQRELVHLRVEAVAARVVLEAQSATRVQAHVRAYQDNKITAMLKYERDCPPKEKKRRAKAATAVAAARRAMKARAMIKAMKAEYEEINRAMKALLRVRKARAQKRKMQEAAELAAVLGISKWAALWMLKDQEPPPQSRPSSKQEKRLTRLAKGPLAEVMAAAEEEAAEKAAADKAAADKAAVDKAAAKKAAAEKATAEKEAAKKALAERAAAEKAGAEKAAAEKAAADRAAAESAAAE